MNSTLIVTKNLVRRFDDLLAVDQLSIEVQQGEIFGFLGHNGAGKTTTVRLLNGLLAADEGEARVFGLSPFEHGSVIRARTGVLTETPALEERLSARENLTIFADLYGVDSDQVSKKASYCWSNFHWTLEGMIRSGNSAKG
jgi:ABC-2 type transport system ATP-binding protein